MFKANNILNADAFYKSICPNVYLFTFIVPFKRLFAPTSQSQISKKNFRFGILWVKVMEKVVSDLKTFTNKRCKIAARKKNCFCANFALLSMIFLVSVFLTPFNNLFAPTSRSPMSKLFRVSESLGKSNGKKWSQIWKLLLIKGVKSPRKKKFFTDFFLFVHYI